TLPTSISRLLSTKLSGDFSIFMGSAGNPPAAPHRGDPTGPRLLGGGSGAGASNGAGLRPRNTDSFDVLHLLADREIVEVGVQDGIAVEIQLPSLGAVQQTVILFRPQIRALSGQRPRVR